jgi:NADPH:quinone reductase
MVYSLTETAVLLPWALNNVNARIEFMLVYTIPESAKLAAVAHINSALADRALSAVNAQRLPLKQTINAHEAVRSGQTGKVLVDVVQRL